MVSIVADGCGKGLQRIRSVSVFLLGHGLGEFTRFENHQCLPRIRQKTPVQILEKEDGSVV